MVFSWQLIFDRIPRNATLLKEISSIIRNNWIVLFCLQSQESTLHLFFNCKYAYLIWGKVYSWLGFQAALPSEAKLHFINYHILVRGKKLKRVETVVSFTTVWSISLHRNNIIFKQEHVNIHCVVYLIKVRSWRLTLHSYVTWLV